VTAGDAGTERGHCHRFRHAQAAATYVIYVLRPELSRGHPYFATFVAGTVALPLHTYYPYAHATLALLFCHAHTLTHQTATTPQTTSLRTFSTDEKRRV